MQDVENTSPRRSGKNERKPKYKADESVPMSRAEVVPEDKARIGSLLTSAAGRQSKPKRGALPSVSVMEIPPVQLVAF
jgi:hypothetical protein